MTVLMVAGVVPTNGSKPYVIMGSDTKKVNIDLSKDELTHVDDFNEKIHEVNGKLIGISGAFPSLFISELLTYINENDVNLEIMTRICGEFVKSYIFNSPYPETRMAIYLAGLEAGLPSIGMISGDKNSLEVLHGFEQVTEGNLTSVTFNSQKDIVDDFRNRIAQDQELDRVHEYATTCLREAAARRPDICNQNVDIRFLSV